MEFKQQDNAVNSKEELKKLREKTDKNELKELKRGLMGGYRKQDVDQFVNRLKTQLQTAERTYKGHISGLTEEKDRLRSERDELLAKLSAVESSVGAASAAVDVRDTLRADNAGLLRQNDELRELGRSLEEERNALQGQLDTLTQEYQTAEASLRGEIKGLESQLEAKGEDACELSRKLEASEKKLVRKTDEAQQMKAQLADIQRENCRLVERAATIERENDGLAAQLETARQNILHLLADKETADGVNTALRESLNSLVVKADAVVKENVILTTRLEEERGRAQQYRAMHEKLSDTLARVRVACSMLDERVVEADKTLQWGAAHITRPVNSARTSDNASVDIGKSETLHNIVSEINNIRNNLSHYRRQLPHEDHESLPEIYRSAPAPEAGCAAE